MLKHLRHGALIIFALGLSLSLAAAADLKIAVVDIDSVSSKYKDLNDKQAELAAWVAEKRDYIRVMKDFEFVAAEEFQEVARIYNAPKAQWTPEQTKREGELRQISSDNERRFGDLQALPARNPEQQNQFNVLRDEFDAREHDVAVIAAEFDKQLKERREAAQGKLVTNVRGVIEKVAKDKGYTLVLDKSAVYYVTGPIDDITEDILKALNAGAAPAPGAADAKPAQPNP